MKNNRWTEDSLEKFIKENKDKFDKYAPQNGHYEHFLVKLTVRFKKFISIIPYLVKLMIVTIIIFIASFIVWRNYICPPLTHVSMKYWKVEHLYKYEINRTTHNIMKYINDSDKNDFKMDLAKYDSSYKDLKKALRSNESANNINNMLMFYRFELDELNNRLIKLNKK